MRNWVKINIWTGITEKGSKQRAAVCFVTVELLQIEIQPN